MSKPRRPLVSGRPVPKVRPSRTATPRIELICVGAELLRGRVPERNGSELAAQLTDRGGRVARVTVVPDDAVVIAQALREALDRHAQLVVLTGGLGTAPDDVTLEAVGETLGLPLARNHEAQEWVEAGYAEWLRQRRVSSAGLTRTREKLFLLPVGTTPLRNPLGLTPGVVCRLAGGPAVVCLPGAPAEARALLQAAGPLLRELGLKAEVARREIETPTADESALHSLLDRLTEEFPDLWITTRPEQARSGAPIVITLEATAASKDAADTAVDVAVRRLLALASGSP
ncbi:MAG TPA: molybdopterin-binding protein [Candidatus Polarisedimenticolaceae bacterium]|nr:molybdopterin-binding protein [Candidatus Polarisedimenticolaceae bacterium]